MSDSLILNLTTAGRLAMLDHVDNGYDLSLVSVKLGTGNYVYDPLAQGLKTPWAEFPLINGFVDTDKHCMNFIASGQTNSEIKVSEIGLFDKNGVLFALICKEAGYFFQTEKASFFSFSFSISFDQKIDGQKIKLSFQPQNTILSALLKLHTQHKDAHPQYKRFVEVLFQQHINEYDPHNQYIMKSDFESTVKGYQEKLLGLIKLLAEFFEQSILGGVNQVNSNATITLPDNFKANLTTLNHALFLTPEAGHEAWSLTRAGQAFSINVFSRSGTNRGSYSGPVNWLAIDSTVDNPMVDLDMPELVAAGVKSSSGALKITKPENSDIDLMKCAVLMTPEGAHEGWEISRNAAEVNSNIFNRSGTTRIGYGGNVSYALIKPRDGKGQDPIRFPGLLMSGVSETGNFSIARPDGKKWDFTSQNYIVLITPEGSHEAWDISRTAAKIDISVYGRSGTDRGVYRGKVSWAVFQAEGDFDLYRAGTYPITIPPYSKVEVHLVGAGGSGAGSLWASNISGNWLKMAAGGDTVFSIDNQVKLTAGGGKGGYRGVWNNGSAYLQGVAGEGGICTIDKLGEATLVGQKDGEKAYLETAHDWCNRDTRGGLSVYRYGQGGEGGYTVETRKHRCYGAGGGSGAHLHFTYANKSNKAITATLVVGDYGAPDTISPELNNGKSGEAGCATVKTSKI